MHEGMLNMNLLRRQRERVQHLLYSGQKALLLPGLERIGLLRTLLKAG